MHSDDDDEGLQTENIIEKQFQTSFQKNKRSSKQLWDKNNKNNLEHVLSLFSVFKVCCHYRFNTAKTVIVSPNFNADYFPYILT